MANVFPYINHSHHTRMRPLALSFAGLLTCAWDQYGLRRIFCLLGFPMTGFRQRISVSALTAAGRWGLSPLFLSAEHEHSLLASADSKDKKIFTCYVSHDTPFPWQVQSHFCITDQAQKSPATLALQNGVDIKMVSGMLGHFSAGFTLDTYAHVTTASQVEAANTMSNVLTAT